MSSTDWNEGTADTSSSDSGSGGSGQQHEPLLQVLVAIKSRDKTAGAAELDTAAGVDMRPENAEHWFTKVSS
jgi:hypothetical protein